MTTTADSLVATGASCAPNISPRGRRTRLQAGRLWFAVAVGLAGAGVAFRLPWPVRALVFLPAAMSAIGFLQARQNTCVLRAAQGTFEHDDRTTTPAPDAEVAASRRVSRTIIRDTILIGVLAGGLAAATVLVR
jgi:hypothetical protein